MQQAESIHHCFVYLIQGACICLFGLLVISAQTHCSYCNSSPDQAYDSQTAFPDIKEEEETNTINIGVLDFKTATLKLVFIALPVYQ